MCCLRPGFAGCNVGVRRNFFSRGKLIRRSRTVAGVHREQISLNGRIAVFVALHIADLKIRSAGKDELCAGQRSLGRAVDFGNDHGKRPCVDRALRRFADALAVGVVAVLKISGVGVLTFADDIEVGLVIQNSGIVDAQVIACLDHAVGDSLLDIDRKLEVIDFLAVDRDLAGNKRAVFAVELVVRIILDLNGEILLGFEVWNSRAFSVCNRSEISLKSIRDRLFIIRIIS